jgi:8-oxo-dGTP diphosphatase
MHQQHVSRKPSLAAGGVVYCTVSDDASRLAILLIYDKHGNWGLPKGHLEGGETSVQAAQREIAEETGLTCDIGPFVQRISYPVFKRGAWREKHVDYFLAHTACAELRPQTNEGIQAARWLTPEEALATITREQVREVVRRGLQMLGAPDNGED